MNAEKLKNAIYTYKDQMYRLAYSIMKNQPEAEDALQDVFIKCWENRGKIKIDESLKAYLMQSTRNKCLDMIKKQSRKRETGSIEDYEYEYQNEQNIDQIEQLRIVNELIEKLPEKNRTILELREKEDLSFEEISKITENSIENVRTILSRTRKKLKEDLMQIVNFERNTVSNLN
jgi:RNA polymerase sigma-70 factor (ECF subfamily)